jgi:hypothetical protein
VEGADIVSLADERWSSASINDVVSELLLAERGKLPQLLPPHLVKALEAPDLIDPAENRLRLRVLYYYRRWLMGEIPPDTAWYEVRFLSERHIDELLVIGRCGWDDPSDRNELRRVASRRPQVLHSAPGTWRKPILWGHDASGPFTIIEGNHRLTAYESAPNPAPFQIPALVGISPTYFNFHLPDPPGHMFHDFWERPDKIGPLLI